MPQVTVAQARDHFDDLIQAAMDGAEVIITKDSLPVVKMVPMSQARATPQFGSASGKIKMADDFDAPLDDFRDYMG